MTQNWLNWTKKATHMLAVIAAATVFFSCSKDGGGGGGSASTPQPNNGYYVNGGQCYLNGQVVQYSYCQNINSNYVIQGSACINRTNNQVVDMSYCQNNGYNNGGFYGGGYYGYGYGYGYGNNGMCYGVYYAPNAVGGQRYWCGGYNCSGFTMVSAYTGQTQTCR